MELYQLKCFKAVAEKGSITKAADELFITQSALSRVIHRLENELEMQLFDRNGGKITLNEMGNLFLSHVFVALDEIDKGVEELMSFSGRTKIVIYNYLATNIFRQIVDACQAFFPRLTFELHNYESTVDKYPIETFSPSIILSPVDSIENYEILYKFKEKWCIMFNSQYKFKYKCDSGITLKHLSEEHIVFFGTNYDKDFIKNMFFKNGLIPNITFVDTLGESGMQINRCRGIGIVPVSSFRTLAENNMPISAIKIKEYECERNIYLSTKKHFPSHPDERAAVEKIQSWVAEEINRNIEFYNKYFRQ